jgi:hypothetical protein
MADNNHVGSQPFIASHNLKGSEYLQRGYLCVTLTASFFGPSLRPLSGRQTQPTFRGV